MPAMTGESAAAAERPARPWMSFLIGGAAGFTILALTQILTETRIVLGPWALDGNGALALPFVGFPLAVYAGWTALADRHPDGRDLGYHLVAYSIGLILGAGLLGALFALPLALVTGAIYTTWMRLASKRTSDAPLWIVFGLSVLLSAVPGFGLFFITVLPGSPIVLARSRGRSGRIALGALLVGATILVGFVVPLLFVRLPAPGTP
jgi:hypothetical protein